MNALLSTFGALLAVAPSERSALHALYEATDGESWANRSGWLGTGDPCEWFGVGCADGGSVVELHMITGHDAYDSYFGNSMAGTLPSQLSGAAGLAVMYLFDGRVSGTIPTELMELTGLTQLRLANSPPVKGAPTYHSSGPLPMSGTVPTQIASLEGLRVLGIQDSSLSGTLPVELANVSELSFFYCSFNSVSGTVPPQLAALGELRLLNFHNTSLSGSIPTQFSELAILDTLDLDTTSLSGNVPTQLAELTALSRLALGSTLLSGTVHPQLAQITTLTDLGLVASSLSGTTPTQLGELMTLTNLGLGHTSLSGTLPSSVGALPTLTNLGLYDMRLSGTVPASVLRRCTPFGSVECDGLPPFSCSAFGLDRSRLSLTSVGACVPCPSREKAIIKVSLFLVLLPLAVALYIRAVDRFPRFKTWIASASLILSHLQIVGLLSSLTSVESVSSGGALATLQAALLVCISLGTVEPQCLLEPQPEQQYKYMPVANTHGAAIAEPQAVFDVHAFFTSPAVFGVATAFTLPFVAVLAITLAKVVVKWRPPRTTACATGPPLPQPPAPSPPQQQPETPAADAPEPQPSPPANNLGWRRWKTSFADVSSWLAAINPWFVAVNDVALAVDEAAAPEDAPPPSSNAIQAPDGAGDDASAEAAVAATLALVDKYENWTIIVFSLQLPTLFSVGLRTTVLGSYGDVHYSLWVGVPVIVLQLAYMTRLFRHMRAMLGHRGWFGRRQITQLSQARLRARLRYLTARYASHAPYWQFVLWARQLALICVIAGFEVYQHSALVLAEAAAATLVLLVSLAGHCRVQPYAFGYQNRAEVLMSSCSIVALIGASIVYAHEHGSELPAVASIAIGWCIVVLLLGPVVVFMAWLVLVDARKRGAAATTQLAFDIVARRALLEEPDALRSMSGVPTHPTTTSINTQPGGEMLST